MTSDAGGRPVAPAVRAGEFSVLAPHESLTLRASGTVRAEGLPASAACSLSRGDVPPATPLVRPGVVPATPP